MFESFGLRLRKALKIAGITQKAVAKELNISPQAMTNYVNGRIPEALILYRISKICSVSMEWLLTGEGNGPENINMDNLGNEILSNGTFVDGSSLKESLCKLLIEGITELHQKTSGVNKDYIFNEANVLSEKVYDYLQKTLLKNPMVKYIYELIASVEELNTTPSKYSLLQLISLLEKELIKYEDKSAVIPEKLNEYEMKLLNIYRKLDERNQGVVDNFVRERFLETSHIKIDATNSSAIPDSVELAGNSED